jgi:hypothetical protein
VKPIDQLPRGYHQRPIDLPHRLNDGRYPANQPRLMRWRPNSAEESWSHPKGLRKRRAIDLSYSVTLAMTGHRLVFGQQTG